MRRLPRLVSPQAPTFVGYPPSNPAPTIAPMPIRASTSHSKPHPGMSFVTMTTRDRKPIFQTSRLAELFIETLLHYRTRGHFKLHAFLVMPDRVHLLLTPQVESLDQTISLLQNGSAERIEPGDVPNSDSTTLWEPHYAAHPIPNLRNLETLRTYLHYTPVRTHLAAAPELYPYSSAHSAKYKVAPLPSTTFITEKAS